jgi:hypothetical protein
MAKVQSRQKLGGRDATWTQLGPTLRGEVVAQMMAWRQRRSRVRIVAPLGGTIRLSAGLTHSEAWPLGKTYIVWWMRCQRLGWT